MYLKQFNQLNLNIIPEMTYNEFFKKLDSFYNKKGLGAKFYLQHHTFSYAIYGEDNKYVGIPLFESKTYDEKDDPFESTTPKGRYHIIRTIEKKLAQLEYECKNKDKSLL